MTAMDALKTVTPEEYLRLERAWPDKHEYRDGRIVAMTGPSKDHNRVTFDLARHLAAQLEDGRCELFVNDMRVRLPVTNSYVYPNVVVVCGEPAFEDASLDTLLNPTVVIEVLSPSTERYDRAEKFAAYRTLPSIQAIVLVAQDQVAIETFERRGDVWAIDRIADLADALRLEALGCAVALADVYRRVNVADGGAAIDAG